MCFCRFARFCDKTRLMNAGLGKRLVAPVVIVLTTVFGAFMALQAAESRPDPLAPLREARAAFEKDSGGPFAGAILKSNESAPEADRFDVPGATGRWVIVLPYAEDDRVRFLDATFKDGQFVSGVLKVFGKNPEKIDARRFAALRSQFPMIAVKKAAFLYPATSVPNAVKPDPQAIPGADPIARHLGALAGATRRLAVSTDELGYRTLFRDENGKVMDLGVIRKDASANEVYERLRDRVEEAYPDEKGRFSKSRSIPYWRKGEIEYRGE